jgi:FAD/FMN-containing dehydrogenase
MSEPAAEPSHADTRWRPATLSGFGLAVRGRSRVARPRTRDELLDLLVTAPRGGHGLLLRGAGRSYGDATTNDGGAAIDLTGLDRVLAFDRETGIARVEPGVTIGQLWRRSIAERWWPAVVPGTMAVTCGGAAAMNVHGKNNFAAGTFGEHVRSFTLATARGELLFCSRERNADLFHAAIGGLGMLGCFVDLELELKRVAAGRLRVHAFATRDFDDALARIEAERTRADYLVGWHDAHARGAAIGRGLIHRADQLAPGEDPDGERWLRPERQDVPARLFGLVPKGWVWPGMWGAANCGAIRWVNALKYRAGLREQQRPPYLQTHGAFHFLLDYLPRWHWAFRPGGLIQFQPFVPAGVAGTLLPQLVEACQRARLVPYLLVLKRHRPDPFLLSHAVDGFSLAMDFAVTRRNRAALWAHCRALAETVFAAGGRFYWAKDAVLEAGSFARVHGGDAVARFRALKQRLDPDGVLQSDLARRLGICPA